MQQPEKFFPVSWESLHRDTRALAWRIKEAGQFSAIVAIARGGLVPAAIIAREIGIRTVETICVESYDHMKQGETKLLKGVSASLADTATQDHILVVDDLVDTGATARLVRTLLPKAHFATIYAKPLGRPLVDTFITEVSQDTWIYFPWDMGLTFQPPIKEQA